MKKLPLIVRIIIRIIGFLLEILLGIALALGRVFVDISQFAIGFKTLSPFDKMLCFWLGIGVIFYAIYDLIVDLRDYNKIKGLERNIIKIESDLRTEKEAHINSIVSIAMRKFIEEERANLLEIIRLPEDQKNGWRNAIISVVEVELRKAYPNENNYEELIIKRLPKELR